MSTKTVQCAYLRGNWLKPAIDLHLEGMVEDGEPLPEPRPLAKHQANADYARGVWAVVRVDVSRYEGKAGKINITLPRNLIRRIDEAAKARGFSRSGFLAEAARRALGHGTTERF